MSTGGSSMPEQPSRPRQRLAAVRDALVTLHKQIIDGERVPYERTHGRIASSGEFLRLVLHDEFFAWLHPLSELIVAIDQALASDDEPLTESMAAAFVERTRALLTHGGPSFGPKYREVLQRDPGVLVAHGQVIGRLATVH
jgi:hypothetical protein